ncbi:hypothetical protein V6N12_007042 [Hibiscus sabdariffa]|uniref:Reverse transcriptase zinc-binding domain-containing protein n=1 Tax=Hibiscus sabdariffa TaxID=183260 RepID=A0ABR2F0L1_9ROSI
MAPLKASSPDGYPTLFFQKYCDVVGPEVTTYCLSVLNGESDMETINRTRILLTSKRYCNTGDYSVKSGYRLLRADSPDDQTNLAGRLYNQMWAVNLSPKVKITMWRIANNYMPTFANLQGKRLNVNNVCPICHSSSETVEHLMRDCSFVSQLHNALDVPIFQNADMLAWFEWLAKRFCSLNESFKMCFMVSYWVVWFIKNKVVHENIVSSVPDRVIERDNARNILASCVVPHNNVVDALMTESLACFQAIRYAKDLGFKKVIIEAARDFENISFSFARREANKAAHVIARDYRS